MNSFIRENGLSVDCFENFYTREKADEYFHQLQQLDYQKLHTVVRGHTYTSTRRVAVFGDPKIRYVFSGICVSAQEWTPLLLQLKSDVESQTGYHYNSVLLNLYPDGESFIGKHRDNERNLDLNVPIAAVSFGATRNIVFSNKKFPSVTIPLPHGSFYVMHAPTNKLFYHAIPPQPDVHEARISLTFHHIKPAKTCRKRHCVENADDATTFLQENLDSLTESSNDKPYHFSFGHGAYATIQLFNNELKLEVTQCKKSGKFETDPTRGGISISLATWYELTSKIINFDLIYSEVSFIVNNSLLVCNVSDILHLQEINYTTSEQFVTRKAFIKLNVDQLESLKNLIPTITDSIIELLLCKQLPALIIKTRGSITTPQTYSESNGLYQLIKTIETNLCQQIQKVFKCEGCVCLSENQPFIQLRFSIILLLDLEAIANNLCNVENSALDDETFFNKLSVEIYKNLLFSDKMNI